MVEEEKFYKQKHDINIALVYQIELSNILKQITMLDFTYPIDSPQKQKIYLNLVKQFFIRAVPYLSKNDSELYKKEILAFGVSRKVNVKRGTQILSYEFQPELDYRLNGILVELQQKLRPIFTKIRDQEEEGL